MTKASPRQSMFRKGTHVRVRTTNGGEMFTTLVEDYRPTYAATVARRNAAIVIPGWRITSVEPSNIPKKVRAFATRHNINVVRIADSCGGHYEVQEPTIGATLEITRTMKPKACHALAMCRRYLQKAKAEAARR